jgi:AraC family transcriptional regulator
MKVMSEEQTLIIDSLQENASLQVMPNPPLLTSHGSGWSSIHLAHFRQPTWELPKFYHLQHIVIIPMMRQTVTAEFCLDGHLHEVQYHPNDYLNNCIEVYPAALCSKICWDKEAEFTQFYLEPAFVSHVAHESIDPDQVEILFEPKISDPLMYHMCLTLRADLNVNERGNGFYADSIATALSAHLLRHYSTCKHKIREHEDGLSKYRLMQAIEYMNDHLDENVSLASIAAELHMSQYYFCRLFKQSTGMTPHQYLIQQRIERAKQLLRLPELTITQIAQECGFANPSHLAKYFRLHTGVSPQQFRKM